MFGLPEPYSEELNCESCAEVPVFGLGCQGQEMTRGLEQETWDLGSKEFEKAESGSFAGRLLLGERSHCWEYFGL